MQWKVTSNFSKVFQFMETQLRRISAEIEKLNLQTPSTQHFHTLGFHTVSHHSLTPLNLVLHFCQSDVGMWWQQIQYCPCSKWQKESCKQRSLPKEQTKRNDKQSYPDTQRVSTHDIGRFGTSSVKPIFLKHSWIASNCSLYNFLEMMSCITLYWRLSIYLQKHISVSNMFQWERCHK